MIMKQMQKLTIHLKTMDYDSFYQKLINQSVNGWQHNVEREQQLSETDMKWIIYTANIKDLPKSNLCLHKDNSTTIDVPNIVPLEISQLSVDEYNAILHNFVECILKPIQVDDNFTFELSKNELFLSDMLDENSVNKFKSFSRLANKSTGFSHPRDEERWFDFVLSSFNKNLDLDLLVDSLVNDGWTADNSERLARDYEYASSLLKYQQERYI